MATRALGTLTVDLLLRMGGFQQGMDRAARIADKEAKSIERSFNKLSRSVDNVRRNLIGAFAGVASVATVRAIVQIADEYTRLEGRLRLVTSSTAELERVQSSLFGIAQRTRSEFTGVADLYVRLAQSAKELGADQGDLLKFTEGVSNALIVSGTSAQQASGALLQLSQALGGGTVRAEEFNSLLEGAPEIVRVVAQSIERFGGSVAQLRQAVIAGEVSSREFFEAFLRGSDDLAARAQSLPVTVGQAFTRLKNVINGSIGDADLSPLVESINELADLVSDPQFQAGMAKFVALIIDLAALGGKAASAIGQVTNATVQNFRIATGQMSEYEQRLVAIQRIQRELAAKSWLDRDIALGFVSNKILRERLEILQAQNGLGQPTGPTNPRGRPRAGGDAGVDSRDTQAAAKLFDQTRTAAEKFRAEMAELDRLLQAGAITPEIYQRRIAQLREELNKKGSAANLVDELESVREAYAQVLDAGLAAIQGLETPVETQIRQYEETRYALEQLRDTYPGLADAATEALERLRVADLEPIEITAEKIFPEKERKQLSEFWLEASRGVQNILADFIFDPFKGGVKGMLQSFGEMLQRMAAEAVAAQIAEKIFGAGGAGSGGGWLGAAMSAVGSYFGGMADGGYTGDGGKYEPAGVVHRGEYVARAAVVRQPGAREFLDAFNRVGMRAIAAIPGFADGGFVGGAGLDSPMAVPAVPRGSAGGMTIHQSFTINAPAGSVSRSTEQQIAAAAARGLAQASRRNN
jgi:tape measure domain-containing protein